MSSLFKFLGSCTSYGIDVPVFNSSNHWLQLILKEGKFLEFLISADKWRGRDFMWDEILNLSFFFFGLNNEILNIYSFLDWITSLDSRDGFSPSFFFFFFFALIYNTFCNGEKARNHPCGIKWWFYRLLLQ